MTEHDTFYEIKKIVALEDIIEVILGHEIVDETDAFVDNFHNVKVDRDFDWTKLRLLDSQIVDQMLTVDEVKAISAHLRANHGPSMHLLSDIQLRKLVQATKVTEYDAAENPERMDDLPEDLLYQASKPSDNCTIILTGRVTVIAGHEGFRSDVSSWSVLASSSLTNTNYVPDFSAYVSHGPCRCIRITRESFSQAVDASAVENDTKRLDVVKVSSANPSLFPVKLPTIESSLFLRSGEMDDDELQPPLHPTTTNKAAMKNLNTLEKGYLLKSARLSNRSLARGNSVQNFALSANVQDNIEEKDDSILLHNISSSCSSFPFSDDRSSEMSQLQMKLSNGGNFMPMTDKRRRQSMLVEDAKKREDMMKNLENERDKMQDITTRNRSSSFEYIDYKSSHRANGD